MPVKNQKPALRAGFDFLSVLERDVGESNRGI
jgi:hypothetical protein